MMKLGELIQEYREKNHLSQRQFAAACGVSNGYISMLEKGRHPKTDEPIVPSLGVLTRIAEAMSCSLEELLAAYDGVQSCRPQEIEPSIHELRLIEAYRAQPELQGAVDRLLGIEQGGYIQLYAAAHSDVAQKDEPIRMARDRWDALKNAPETDDSLL